MAIVKLPKMNKDEVEELISTQNMCRIAFNGPNYPYLIPFRFIRSNDVLYFHFTDYGKKMRLLERDNQVCVQIESYKPDLSEYNFVSIRGTLERVKDPIEHKRVVQTFSDTGKQLSTKFLAAHGIDPSQGWNKLKDESDLVIVKLVDIVETIGLKEP